MIGYFPDPYPDELWYSVCARFSDHMKFGTETGVMQALYGRRHAIASIDLPIRLEALATQLPPGHSCDNDGIIDRHTFLLYYAPFIQLDAYTDARRYMWTGEHTGVRVKVGSCTNRVRPPKFFRSCPECDRKNRNRRGETYWRRLFQLPGVEVCPIHEVFLEASDVRLDPLPNRHKYFSAESARLATESHPIDSNDRRHRVLLQLAKDIEWLLRQDRLNPSLESLHHRHLHFLEKNGMVTRNGSIRMARIKQRLTDCFGAEFLKLLQCELPTSGKDGWPGPLLRKSEHATAPLRHLLIMRALDVDIEQFFSPDLLKASSQPEPATRGPWPCLSPVCEHRDQATITTSTLLDPDSNGNQHRVLCCPECGLTYQIRDDVENPTQSYRVVDYGTKWINLLTEQWNNRETTLRQIAGTLCVDPKTVKNQANKLGLKFPRDAKRPTTTRGLYQAKGTDTKKLLESKRSEWLRLQNNHPHQGTKAIRAMNEALYAWLHRNDREWLLNNSPKMKVSKARGLTVDWSARDEALAGQIATAAIHIREGSKEPRRVTKTAIGRVLGKQSLFEASMNKLPLTNAVIQKHVETHEDFAVRRIHQTAALLRTTQGPFKRWELVRTAGLSYHMEKRSNVQLALDYEDRPFVNVTTHCSNPKDLPKLLQASGRANPDILYLGGMKSVA